MRKPTLLCALLLLAGQLAQAADSVLIGLSLPRTGHYRAGAVDVAQDCWRWMTSTLRVGC